MMEKREELVECSMVKCMNLHVHYIVVKPQGKNCLPTRGVNHISYLPQ